MKDAVSIFLLDHLDSKILDLTMLRVRRAGVSTIFGGEIRCENGFDIARGQWKADVILADCSRMLQTAQMSLIITERDLYASSLNFVFGLARRDLKAAIVSWHRLRDDNPGVFSERLAKEVVHEVGHLEGLEHCPDPNCVMWFSNTLQETDRKGVNFCQICLQKRG